MVTRSSSHTTRERPLPVTHARDGGLVVFHIGMTIHRPLRPDLWLPVFRAMPRMLAELERIRMAADRGEAEDVGFLGAQTLLGANGPWVVQYWNSVGQLYWYARDAEKAHMPAWRDFNARARRNPGAVGIWHETYVVDEGGIETFYGDGARAGLAAATGTLPLGRRGATARERLNGRTTPTSED
ncbi:MULTISPECIES: DUF4188 domain-containing protein [unclassified Dietzia]|uniref:DUF4188 domain-containing protein n=1 Tax=unclassified Dietzia TaxID=2617939 RepID=UPI0015F79C9B|nr:MULTISPECIES: DUF4188 domain-containing protein [unclassified Dietzia]MBB1024062.1 DUF4188 domain-containing protein [Dietzia sp. DQ12-76]MBB1028418.1 DUF4188 domain-containing protein [Dietzia sp. DQ11-38-2]